MAEYPLFQVGDGGSIPTSPLHFHIRQIPCGHSSTTKWIKKWHYSGRMPRGKNIIFGLWASGNLYAVIIYGIGINPYQASFLGVDRVVEIKRMARCEPRLDYHLSRFIAITTKMARKEYDFDAVVAFADPEHGHKGTVYKGAGFVHEGMSNAEWHCVDREGNRRHRRVAYRYAQKNNTTIAQARDILGYLRVQCPPKHRWVKRF